MKKLIALMAVGLISASAYAADFKITGDAFVRGSTVANAGNAGTTQTQVAKSWYDMEFHIFPVIQVDKSTKVVMKMTADFDTVPNKTSKTTFAKEYNTDTNSPSLTIENLYLSHMFESTGTELLAGLFTGGLWGTSFNDTEYNAFRVRVNQKIPYGTLVLYTQKNTEAGSDADIDNDKDKEKNDSDTYVIGANLKFGNISVKPNFSYTTKGNNKEYKSTKAEYTSKTYDYKLAVDGKFGMIGFEAEGVYTSNKNAKQDDGELADYNIYGLYGNVYANISNITAGVKYVYSSVTKEKGETYAFEYGDNFDSTLVIDDYLFEKGIKGMSMYQIYGDMKVMDPLTVGLSATLYTSNFGKGESVHDTVKGSGFLVRNWGEDTKAWEIDASASYAITKNLTYSIGAGYAKISDLYNNDGSKFDADGAYRLYHKLAVKF
ncbi:hypothetical protein [Calditerrivibrio nitroreducens]|uniref:Uncharacterized protein n=1 Tax=Calditerrivibrio nitroreducens (strain DSM 19672 / NBRC 101217 / Yu37-1) TaxID=768670 RepID=E4TFU5_CALNY|nr:hypothetical protein [Calditerrivibrio nitroreducens]ADR19601.1 hypothetical protein Calni_1695 [Calditerrivibrio nitroreducens DSM 19672]